MLYDLGSDRRGLHPVVDFAEVSGLGVAKRQNERVSRGRRGLR